MTVYGVTPEDTFIWSVGHLRQYPTPAGGFSDLGFWLNASALWMENPSTVVFSRAPQGMNGEQLYAAVHAAGWSTQKTDGGWFTCRLRQGKTSRIVNMCILPWVPSTDVMIGRLAQSGWNNTTREVVRVLGNWIEAMGTHYRYTPGVAGHDALRAIPRRKSISWSPYRDKSALPTWEAPANIRALSYVDKPEALAALAPGTLHKWDTRSAYLRAMSAASYPEGPVRPTGTDPQGPGYLRVRIQVPHDRGTLLIPAHVNRILLMAQLKLDRQGTCWMGTATAEVLTSVGCRLEIVESETAPGGRIMRTWAEKVGKLPKELGKAVYVEAFGNFGSRAGSIQRRDWYHLTIDQANATLLRRILAVGAWRAHMWPERIETDAVVYRVTPDELSDVGTILGAGMRYEGEWSK